MYKPITHPAVPARPPAVPCRPAAVDKPREEAPAQPSYRSVLARTFANLVWLR